MTTDMKLKMLKSMTDEEDRTSTTGCRVCISMKH